MLDQPATRQPGSHLPTSPSDPRNVHCVSADGKVDVVWTLDTDAAPELSAGWSGWTEETRARRRSLLVWAGPPAWRQDVPVLLDAWLDASLARAQAAARRASGQAVGSATSAAEALVAKQYAAIQHLSTPASATTGPATCSLSGAALEREGGNWVLMERRRAETPLRNVDDGTLLRWRGVLSFAQLVSRDILEISGLATPAKGRTKLYTWRQGDTLQRVAAHVLGSAKRWQELTWPDGSKIRPGDPKLKPGAQVRYPTT